MNWRSAAGCGQTCVSLFEFGGQGLTAWSFLVLAVFFVPGN
jgi:hypothetical protein